MRPFNGAKLLLPALLAYGLLLVLSGLIGDTFAPSNAVKIVTVLLPIIGIVLVLLSIVRAVRNVDEFHRRIQFEAIVFAFVATAFSTFSWGFLEGIGLPKLPTFAIWPVMAAFWALGTVLSSRRYL